MNDKFVFNRRRLTVGRSKNESVNDKISLQIICSWIFRSWRLHIWNQISSRTKDWQCTCIYNYSRKNKISLIYKDSGCSIRFQHIFFKFDIRPLDDNSLSSIFIAIDFYCWFFTIDRFSIVTDHRWYLCITSVRFPLIPTEIFCLLTSEIDHSSNRSIRIEKQWSNRLISLNTSSIIITQFTRKSDNTSNSESKECCLSGTESKIKQSVQDLAWMSRDWAFIIMRLSTIMIKDVRDTLSVF